MKDCIKNISILDRIHEIPVEVMLVGYGHP